MSRQAGCRRPDPTEVRQAGLGAKHPHAFGHAEKKKGPERGRRKGRNQGRRERLLGRQEQRGRGRRAQEGLLAWEWQLGAGRAGDMEMAQ